MTYVIFSVACIGLLLKYPAIIILFVLIMYKLVRLMM